MSEDTGSMDGRWCIVRADGRPIGGEYTWVTAGKDDEPDWSWPDEEESWEDDPVTYVAERVTVVERIVRTYFPCDVEGETPDPTTSRILRRGTSPASEDQ